MACDVLPKKEKLFNITDVDKNEKQEKEVEADFYSKMPKLLPIKHEKFEPEGLVVETEPRKTEVQSPVERSSLTQCRGFSLCSSLSQRSSDRTNRHEMWPSLPPLIKITKPYPFEYTTISYY